MSGPACSLTPGSSPCAKISICEKEGEEPGTFWSLAGHGWTWLAISGRLRLCTTTANTDCDSVIFDGLQRARNDQWFERTNDRSANKIAWGYPSLNVELTRANIGPRNDNSSQARGLISLIEGLVLVHRKIDSGDLVSRAIVGALRLLTVYNWPSKNFDHSQC